VEGLTLNLRVKANELIFGCVRGIKNLKEKTAENMRRAIGLKPNLKYFEYHLADHCNLSCKCCSHFSPIREKQFANVEEYKRDLQQLQKLFANVLHIELLGGEPLLHPQVVDFLTASRNYFPKAEIGITTNGVLLSKMPESFWDACKVCRAIIYYTVYPPFQNKQSELEQLAKSKGVKMLINQANTFHNFYNKNGDTNVEAAFKKCRSRFYCPMLRDGKIYVCCLSCNIRIFNEQYNLQIPDNGFISIYGENVSGWQVIDRLNKASPTCRYCTLGWDDVPIFNWKSSRGDIADWEAGFDSCKLLKSKDKSRTI
jgi:hypothetical protein